MVKVAIVPNYSRQEAVLDASRLTEFLEKQSIEVVWAPDKKKTNVFPLNVDNTDLVISLGGDGTLLRAAKITGYREIPILGLSYGHLGFLTSAGPDELQTMVQRALAGELHVSRRATLQITSLFLDERGQEIELHNFALNDFSLSHGSKGDMIVFNVDVSGHHIDTLRGDGFVVATATGSTGYALAAGGPIVTPTFTGMLCVPVAPHTILARAFLTASSDVVEISISTERNVERLFFADGQPLGAQMTPLSAKITRGQGDILLLEASPSCFYQSVSRVFYGQASHD